MKRIEAIQEIMKTVDDDTVVVSSCGMISREVFATKDRPLNFYVTGSMGATLSIAIGIALCRPKRKVVVIVGDGEVLMGLGTLVLLKKLQMMEIDKHLKNYQERMKNSKEKNSWKFAEEYAKENKKFNIDLYILDNNQYQSTGGQKTCSDVVQFKFLCDCNVIFVNGESSDVGRIPLTPVEIKERFMKAIK